MEPSDFETIRWSVDDRGVGRIVLDRPEKHNAMSKRTLRELKAAFEAFERVDHEGEGGVTVRVVVVEGAGDEAFSAGADVSEFGDETYPYVDATWWDSFETMAEFGAPVVAKVDGYCVGGGLELALTFDFRYASARSTFGFPEVDLGMFPTGGGTQRLPRLVGPSRAKELMMTGEYVDARTAAEDGFVDHVSPVGDFEAEVEGFVDDLADKPPLSLRAIKDTVGKTAELGLREGIAYERQAALPVYESADYAEGVAAWSEDREAEWEGR